jgi:hypothetical protein
LELLPDLLGAEDFRYDLSKALRSYNFRICPLYTPTANAPNWEQRIGAHSRVVISPVVSQDADLGFLRHNRRWPPPPSAARYLYVLLLHHLTTHTSSSPRQWRRSRRQRIRQARAFIGWISTALMPQIEPLPYASAALPQAVMIRGTPEVQV